MNTEEACKVLGLSSDASEGERHDAYRTLQERLEAKITKAPTPGLKEKYRTSLVKLEQAIEVIELSADGGDLPMLRPDYDSVDVVTADTSTKPELGKAEALGAKKIKAQASGAGSKKEVLIAAVVVLLLCGVCAGWWFGFEAPRREQVSVLVVKAKGLEEKGALQKAADIYEDALEVKNSSKDAEAGLARVRGALDRISAEQAREVDRLLVRARMNQSQERWVDALASYQKIVNLNPDHVEASESVLQLKSLLENARGSVVVKTDPGGATVRLGGRGEDQSPANYEDMKLGNYSVEVEKKGYDPVKKNVVVRKDDTTILGPLRLSRSEGGLKISSEPPGMPYTLTRISSAVISDKEFETRGGNTPAVESNLTTGVYRVVMKNDRWPDFSESVTVKRDLKGIVKARFVHGILELVSKPSGALVIDSRGMKVGVTPYRAKLPPGKARLRLISKQLSEEVEVEVIADELVKKLVILKKTNPVGVDNYADFTDSKDYPRSYGIFKVNKLLREVNVENSFVHVSLADQRARIVCNGLIALDIPVSTGRRELPTKAGTFKVVKKERSRVSDIGGKLVSSDGGSRIIKENFNRLLEKQPEGTKLIGWNEEFCVIMDGMQTGDANMFYMANVPRYPASEGGIRVFKSIASDFFAWVPIGMVVVIE